jgi:hypothetical protein
MARETHYFFRMKVGTGNSAFSLALLEGLAKPLDAYPKSAREKAELEAECQARFSEGKLAGRVFRLFTGYETRSWIPVLQPDGSFEAFKTPQRSQPASERAEREPASPSKQPDDLYWMAYAVSPLGAEQSRILVYGATHLFVFKPRAGAWHLWSPYPGSQEVPKALRPDLKRLLSREEEESAPEDFFSANRPFGGALETELCQVVSRIELAPAIDSLAVYQWLNQGAFRPIFSCGREREKQMPERIEPKLPKVQILKTGKAFRADTSPDNLEYRYGAIVREQFEALLSGQSVEGAGADFIYLLLSPAQLEAAAALLCMDLGYIPDYYSAGSHDYIDIRARRADYPEAHSDLGSRIEALLRAQRPDWTWPRDTLQIQCKDYEGSDDTADDSVILFEPLPTPAIVKPKASKNPQLRLNLKEVFEIQRSLSNETTSSFFLKTWLLMQQELLTRKPQAPSGPPLDLPGTRAPALGTDTPPED